MSNAPIAITRIWAVAGSTSWVTGSLVDGTVFTEPVIVTNAVAGAVCRGMSNTSVAVSGVWTVTGVAFRVALANVGHTVITGPVWETDTVSEGIELSVLVTVLTV
jgi:hypothetical protein